MEKVSSFEFDTGKKTPGGAGTHTGNNTSKFS